MATAYEYLYRQMCRVTIAALWLALGFFVFALGSALLGLPQAVVSFRQCALAMGVVAGVLFVSLSIAYLIHLFANRSAAANGR